MISESNTAVMQHAADEDILPLDNDLETSQSAQNTLINSNVQTGITSNTSNTNDGVLLVLQDDVLPVNSGNSAVNGVLHKNGNTSNTTDEGSSMPSYTRQEPPRVEQVIPGSNTSDANAAPRSNTDYSPLSSADATIPDEIGELKSKSFRLPLSVIQSMERAVYEINQKLPPHEQTVSTHSYGVEILSNHDAYRSMTQQSIDLRSFLDKEQKNNLVLHSELAEYRKRISELEDRITLLVIEKNDLLKIASEHNLLVSQVDESLASLTTELDHEDEQEANTVANTGQVDALLFQRLSDEYRQLAHQNEAYKKRILILQKFVEEMPGVVTMLCKEAERLSYTRAEYFEWFFNGYIRMIAPY